MLKNFNSTIHLVQQGITNEDYIQKNKQQVLTPTLLLL